MDKYPVEHPSGDTYKVLKTLCFPKGAVTPAGLDKLFQSTSKPDMVTCPKCKAKLP